MRIDETLLFMALRNLPEDKKKRILKEIIMPELNKIRKTLNDKATKEKDTRKT